MATVAELKRELAELVAEGWGIYRGLIARGGNWETDEASAEFKRLMDDPNVSGDPVKVAAAFRKAIDDGTQPIRRYQQWYFRALSIVQQVAPERAIEFEERYRLRKQPRELTYTTYTISDSLAGTRVSRGGAEAFSATSATEMCTRSQVSILESVLARFDSAVANLRGVLEASMFDDELSAARDLLMHGHLRASGALAGVALERHLKTVAGNRSIKLKPTAMLANVNDALKDASVIDVPEWRRIQRLADLRNLCAHAGRRDPQRDDVQELIAGAEKVIKTVF